MNKYLILIACLFLSVACEEGGSSSSQLPEKTDSSRESSTDTNTDTTTDTDAGANTNSPSTPNILNGGSNNSGGTKNPGNSGNNGGSSNTKTSSNTSTSTSTGSNSVTAQQRANSYDGVYQLYYYLTSVALSGNVQEEQLEVDGLGSITFENSVSSFKITQGGKETTGTATIDKKGVIALKAKINDADFQAVGRVIENLEVHGTDLHGYVSGLFELEASSSNTIQGVFRGFRSIDHGEKVDRSNRATLLDITKQPLRHGIHAEETQYTPLSSHRGIRLRQEFDGKGSLRFTTFNTALASGDLYRSDRLTLLIEALKQHKAHVICLQELWDVKDREKVIEALKSLFPHHYHFEPTSSDSDFLEDGDMGLLLLSTDKLRSEETLDLKSKSTRYRRGALYATVTLNDQTRHIACTQLTPDYGSLKYEGSSDSWEDEALEQAKALISFMDDKSTSDPQYIMGDLGCSRAENTIGVNAQFSEVCKQFTDTSTFQDPVDQKLACSFCPFNRLNLITLEKQGQSVSSNRGTLIDHIMVRNHDDNSTFVPGFGFEGSYLVADSKNTFDVNAPNQQQQTSQFDGSYEIEIHDGDKVIDRFDIKLEDGTFQEKVTTTDEQEEIDVAARVLDSGLLWLGIRESDFDGFHVGYFEDEDTLKSELNLEQQRLFTGTKKSSSNTDTDTDTDTESSTSSSTSTSTSTSSSTSTSTSSSTSTSTTTSSSTSSSTSTSTTTSTDVSKLPHLLCSKTTVQGDNPIYCVTRTTGCTDNLLIDDDKVLDSEGKEDPDHLFEDESACQSVCRALEEEEDPNANDIEKFFGVGDKFAACTSR